MSTRSHGSAPFDLLRLLDALEGVDYIIVGGVAGTLHGSPRLTLDLDIVPDSAVRNVDRLAKALERLQATVREPGGRRLATTRQLLRESAGAAVGGQLRLRTQYGPLDILWRLHDGRRYAQLRDRSVILSDDERRLCVVDLDALIEIKEAAGRTRDREDVAYLRRIRRRRP